jgi:hypothetical protein
VILAGKLTNFLSFTIHFSFSHSIHSLYNGRDNYVITFAMEINAENLKIKKWDIFPSIIRNIRNLPFNGTIDPHKNSVCDTHSNYSYQKNQKIVGDDSEVSFDVTDSETRNKREYKFPQEIIDILLRMKLIADMHLKEPSEYPPSRYEK